jgi:predicted nucleotidyltransferase
LTSVVVKSINRPAIVEAVEAYIALLRRQNPEIIRVIWFGSWINGLPTPGSDVDVCLILSASPKPFRERQADYLPVGFPVGLDLFAYTQAEFEQLRQVSPGWYQAISAGREM